MNDKRLLPALPHKNDTTQTTECLQISLNFTKMLAYDSKTPSDGIAWQFSKLTLTSETIMNTGLVLFHEL